MFSKRTSTAAAPASEPPPPAAGGSDRSSTASTTTTSRSSIFSTFSAMSAISSFSNKSNATATKPPSAPEAGDEVDYTPVDITPLIPPTPAVTDASVFFPRNPNSKHLVHLTALNNATPGASAAPSAAPSTAPSAAASTSTSPAPSIRGSVVTATGPSRTLNLPPLTLPSLSTPTTPNPYSAHGPLSPTPSTMSHFSFSYAPSFHGSVIGINNLPNIPQATVTRLVQTYFTIQAMRHVGYQAAVAGRCAGVVHRVPFAFGGAVGGEEGEEEDWEVLGGGDLFGDSGVDLVLSRLEHSEAGERVEELLAKRFPQWFCLEDKDLGHELAADNASILSGDGVSGHRRTRSHPGEIAIPDPAAPAPDAPTATTRSRSGTTTTITPPKKQLYFHDPSNLLSASFAAFSFSSPSSPSGGRPPPIDFSSVISFAADHPPPPVSPTGDTSTTTSAAASDAGDDHPPAVTLRTPLAIHIHHIPTPKKGPQHPYTWLPPLTHTTLSTPNPPIGVSLSGPDADLNPIPLPTLPLPTLLITSLLTAHGLLRSLSMTDRKLGNIALRQAVNLASFIRMRGGLGSAADGGGVVSLPGGVPKDALGVLARLRGEKGTEERRVVLWALRSGVSATEPMGWTAGGVPPAKHQHPGGLKRTYTAGANAQLRELVLVSKREGEGWRRSAPAAVDYGYAVSSWRQSAAPSVRSISGVSVQGQGQGRNSVGTNMGYVEEEEEQDGGAGGGGVRGGGRGSVDSQAGELAELRREMQGGGGGGELLSPVGQDAGAAGVKRGASMRWSFKGWGGGGK